MGRVPDALLVVGAATIWYVLAWTWFSGPFATYGEASLVGVLLLGLGLIGKVIQGVAWIARRMKGT